MKIGEKEKTATYPKRTVAASAPAKGAEAPQATPVEGWPVRKEETAIPAPAWPLPATVEPTRQA